MTVHLENIIWDTDGKDIDLPNEDYITGFANGYILTEEDEENVINKISDKHGFCIKSANIVCFDSD